MSKESNASLPGDVPLHHNVEPAENGLQSPVPVACDSAETRTGERLIDKKQLAEKLNCSPRHVDRLRDRRAMPLPLSLGPQLIRWREAEIDRWIEAGCPPLHRFPKHPHRN